MSHSTEIGDVLVKAGIVDTDGLARALDVRARDGGTLARILADLGLADEEAACRTIGKSLGLPCPTLDTLKLSPEIAQLLPVKLCRSRFMAPIGREGRSVRLAMADPFDASTIRDVESTCGKKVIPCVASETAILKLLARTHLEPGEDATCYDAVSGRDPSGEAEITLTESDVADIAQLAKDVNQPPTIRLVNMILSDAANAGASDIHIEAQEGGLLVRQRIDGILRDIVHLPKKSQDATISRFKIIAGMDISERRRPQDGRSRLRFQGRRIDLRISTLPTQFGEKVVVRLLDSSSARLELKQLDFADDTLQRFLVQLARPQGLILVTGPTGSGKTSTLYASVSWLKSPKTNIITVEDPIEYQVPGINQVQIHAKAGMTFATGLRSILRQDPNVVLVGEIRDRETAAIALEAAQTGHLLLSTLHTNDAAGSITRLIDLGVEPYLVAASLTSILAQRLMRRTCPMCAEERQPTAEEIEKVGGAAHLPADGIWKAGRGCDACKQTGYKGRIAVHELLTVDDRLRELISAGSAEYVLREAARKAGMKTLMEDAVHKAASGLTTLEEVVRIAPPDTVDAGATDTPHGHDSDALGTGPSESLAVSGLVLVVEDSPTVTTVVKYFLELEGFEVVLASDGEAGLREARRRRPDVVVTDVNMPVMGGVALVSALRKDPLTSDVAILMLTSESSVESEAQGLSAGADDYLIKPVEPRRLAARIRALLARAKSVRTVA